MKNRKKIKGFTLMEVVVAMFIFVMVISASTAAFANMFRSYKDAKNIQENMENAQYAMSIMAKTFRTSSIVGADNSNADTIEVYDYSQEECFRYYFDGADLLVSRGGTPNDPNDPAGGCSGFSGYQNMTDGQVTGRFSFEASDDTASNEKVGKITVSMTISEGSNSVNLQTTTSLRDYVESGISL